MLNWKLLILATCGVLVSCAKITALTAPAGPEPTKLYDSVVFEMTRARVLTPPGMQDSTEFLKTIAERTMARVEARLQERKKHDLKMVNTCGSRTIKVVSDISAITFRQKGTVSFWHPFRATSEVIQKVKITTVGTVIDCTNGNTVSRFHSSAENEDYDGVINELAGDMAEAAAKTQWSK